jgi:hypothetical protein
MSTDRDVTRIVRSWLEDGATALPDRVLDTVLDQLPATSQRRAWWPAWRFREMNSALRLAIAAAAVVVVAIVGINLVGVPGPSPTPSPSPSPTSSPMPLLGGRLTPGRYQTTPFAELDALGVCMTAAPACTESPADDTIRFEFTVPDGWAGAPFHSVWLYAGNNSPPGGAGLIFVRGGGLYSEPCGGTPSPDIPVGPSVDDFANALAEHPTLGATTPVDVTLGGYSGKFLEFQAPADLSACPTSFFPWEPGLYAQGPSQGWHLWIVDVEGTRVVVLTNDYPGTSAEDRAELQAIVDSIQIEP